MSSKITIKDSASKTHVCMFCGEQQLKLSRHLRRKHKDESIVTEAMALKDGSKAFERIRLRGDYHHNCNVMALGEGELIVVRNPGSKQPFGDASSFLPCPDCLGFFKGDELWRHNKRCQHKATEPKKWKKLQLEARLLLPTASTSTAEVDKELFSNVLAVMKNDSISSVARHDEIILKFGAAILEKVGKKNSNYVSQRMRQLARLLTILRARSQEMEAGLKSFIDTTKFDDLVEAVKELCRFNEESRLDIGIPSLALKLGHSIKRCAQVVKGSALRNKDGNVIKRAKRFIDLFESEWTSKISSRSLASLGSKKQNKVDYLPLAEDLTRLKNHLDSKITSLSSALEAEGPVNVEQWSNLARSTLSRIILFNKRRSGETATLEINQFVNRPDWSSCSSDMKKFLSPLERRLCERYQKFDHNRNQQNKMNTRKF